MRIAEKVCMHAFEGCSKLGAWEQFGTSTACMAVVLLCVTVYFCRCCLVCMDWRWPNYTVMLGCAF